MANLEMNCDILTKKVLSEMEADGYSYSMTHRHVNYIYRSLTKFCNENYGGIYSPAVGQEFLSINRARIPPLRKATFNYYEISIMRLDFALSGNYHWNPFVIRQQKPYPTSCFSPIIGVYEEYLQQEGKKEANVRARIHILSRFLKYADDAGISYICTDRDAVPPNTWEGHIRLIDSPIGEIEVKARGSYFHILFGHYINGYYICIPNINVGTDLAKPDNVFWNREHLSACYPKLSRIDIISITEALAVAQKYLLV